MLDKEVAELRRRFRYQKNNLSTLYGCYVNGNKEIITTFSRSFQMLDQDEQEKYLGFFRRNLAGNVGKNLLELPFTNEQVLSSEEHTLLRTLRDSKLKDEEALQTFCGKIVENLDMGCNYLILLAHDTYDVFTYGKEGEKSLESESQFSYITGCVCPMKPSKPALCYDPIQASFRSKSEELTVAAPEWGFLFPAFDNRSANLYSVLYTNKNLSEHREALITALFGTPVPAPANIQKEAFGGILSSSLEEECSYDVVQTVHDKLLARVEAQKEQKDEPFVAVTKSDLKNTLTDLGVSEAKVESFEKRFDESFGEHTEICPRNLLSGSGLELCTDDVKVRVDAAHSDLVETRLLDGKPCIIIHAEGNLTVNGISVKIRKQ